MIAGLLLTLWIGIGAQVYKPSAYKPPISVDGCVNLTVTDPPYTHAYENYTEQSDLLPSVSRIHVKLLNT